MNRDLLVDVVKHPDIQDAMPVNVINDDDSSSSIQVNDDAESIILLNNEEMYNAGLIEIARFIARSEPMEFKYNVNDSNDSGVIDLTDSDDDETVILEYPLVGQRLVEYTNSEEEEEEQQPAEPDPTEPTPCPVCPRTLANRLAHIIKPCNHFACFECLSTWASTLAKKKLPCKCPLCQHPMAFEECERVFL